MIRLKTSSIQRALPGTLLAASAAIMTTPTAAYSDVVTDWNEIAIQTFPPTVLGPTQARFLGIVHAAIYDAINAIDRKHQVYAIDIKAPPGASMEAAAATAAHDTLIKLFPVQQSALDIALAESLSKIPDGPAKRDGITVGKESAEKTVAAHANDGCHGEGAIHARDVTGLVAANSADNGSCCSHTMGHGDPFHAQKRRSNHGTRSFPRDQFGLRHRRK